METNNILTKLPELGRSQYWIPVQNMDRLQIKLARLDRKAEKLGLPGIMFNLHETVSVLLVNTGEGGVTEKRVERFTRVTVAGDAPEVAGWQFVATIQHEDKLNVFRTLPMYEGEIPTEFRTSTPDRCDHCHTSRMRTDTYVVRNDAGQFKQVGRTCLRDFLGHSSPETLAQWASVIFQLKDVMEEFEETGTGGERVYSIDRVMRVAHAIIGKFGYISKAQGELQSKTPTSNEVKAALLDPKFNLEKLLEGVDVAAMEAEIAAALAWVAGLGQEELENSSYLYTCFAIVTNDMVRHSQVGFAASILVAYRRDVERRRALDNIRNEHLGTMGEKLTFTGEVTRLQVLEFSTLVNFSAGGGACVVWFGSGKQLDKLELGKSYTVTAKVTKHGEFRGVKQTQITRPTIK